MQSSQPTVNPSTLAQASTLLPLSPACVLALSPALPLGHLLQKCSWGSLHSACPIQTLTRLQHTRYCQTLLTGLHCTASGLCFLRRGSGNPLLLIPCGTQHGAYLTAGGCREWQICLCLLSPSLQSGLAGRGHAGEVGALGRPYSRAALSCRENRLSPSFLGL